MEIHVVDIDPKNTIAELQDTSKIEKYVMSDEKYNERETSYKKWKEQQAKEQQAQETMPTHVKEDDRVSVLPQDPNGPIRHGTVKFIGKIEPHGTGYWIGVHLDEPQGKNDGSVKGTRFFECPPNHGVFAKGNKVIILVNFKVTNF